MTALGFYLLTLCVLPCTVRFSFAALTYQRDSGRYELDEDVVAAARDATQHEERIIIHEKDALQARACIAQADVVALYLTERGNSALLPLLREALRPSARVVSYVWDFGDDLPPTRTATATGPGVVVKIPNLLCWDAADLEARSSVAIGLIKR